MDLIWLPLTVAAVAFVALIVVLVRGHQAKVRATQIASEPVLTTGASDLGPVPADAFDLNSPAPYAAEIEKPGSATWRVEPAEPLHVAGKGQFNQVVTSDDSEQILLDQICGGRSNAQGHNLRRLALLRHEPPQKQRSHTVGVVIDGLRVGQLTPEDADRWFSTHGWMGQPHTCDATITGGWIKTKRNGSVREGAYSVILDLFIDDDLSANDGGVEE